MKNQAIRLKAVRLLGVFIIVFSLNPFILRSAPPERWDNQIQFTRAHEIEIWQGETIEIMPRFFSYSVPWAISPNAVVSLSWSTNNFATTPWHTNTGVAVLSETGRVDVTWLPAYDCVGAKAYQFFVGIEDASQLLYRAMGIIHMHSSPGWQPSSGPLPVWDGWTNNYVYAKYSDLLGTSNALYSAAFGHTITINGQIGALSSNLVFNVAGGGGGGGGSVFSVNGQTGIVSISTVSTATNAITASVVTGAQSNSIATALQNVPGNYLTTNGIGSALVGITASQVGADPAGAAAGVTTTSIGAVPNARTITVNGIVGALSSNLTYTITGPGTGDVQAIVSGSMATGATLTASVVTGSQSNLIASALQVQTAQVYVAQAGTAAVSSVALSGWPAPVAQTAQVYCATAGTVTGSQSNTIAMALQPCATNLLATALQTGATNGLYLGDALRVIESATQAWVNVVGSNSYLNILTFTNSVTINSNVLVSYNSSGTNPDTGAQAINGMQFTCGSDYTVYHCGPWALYKSAGVWTMYDSGGSHSDTHALGPTNTYSDNLGWWTVSLAYTLTTQSVVSSTNTYRILTGADTNSLLSTNGNGSGLSGITAAQVGALSPAATNTLGTALQPAATNSLGTALQPAATNGLLKTSATNALGAALATNGNGSALSGITAAQVGADAAGAAAAVTTATIGAVPTTRTISLNGTVGALSSNLVFNVAGTTGAITNNQNNVSLGTNFMISGNAGILPTYQYTSSATQFVSPMAAYFAYYSQATQEVFVPKEVGIGQSFSIAGLYTNGWAVSVAASGKTLQIGQFASTNALALSGLNASATFVASSNIFFASTYQGTVSYYAPLNYTGTAYTTNYTENATNYYAIVFTGGTGTLNLIFAQTADYLVVAGGGGGGKYYGSGGGAGGLIRVTSTNLPAGSYPVFVGGGGIGVTSIGSAIGGNGTNSLFASTVALGGGGGVGNPSATNGLAGGSGGGAGGGGSATGGAGTAGQGKNGGNNGGVGGAGGGGANAAGSAVAGSVGGAGGGGTNCTFSGANTFYAGGGGGSYSSGGAGGAGGGGVGAVDTTVDATSGAVNTGGGGGGGSNTKIAGSGGSGIVIIRFPTAAW